MGLALLFTIQIIYYKKKGSTAALASAIQNLVLAETVEVTIPEVLGNIKNRYFHYTAVDDVWASFQMLCIIMAIELVLLIICYGTLYKFAKIDLLKVNTQVA